jgi:hypothetical protein
MEIFRNKISHFHIINDESVKVLTTYRSTELAKSEKRKKLK